MRTKYNFWMMIIGLLLMLVIGVSAQTNTVTCPTLVQEAFTATEFLCESVEDGQGCIGNGVVSTTPIGDASVQFANPGEIATLADIQRLQVQTLNTESQAWTSVLGKLDATTRNGDPEIIDMLVFGDAVITNAIAQSTAGASAGILPGTIEAGGGVIVRQEPRPDSNNIWQLLNNESVETIGRSADNQWVRIIIPSPNGGAGWVFGQFVNIEGGRELLPFQTNDSPVPASSATPTTSLKSMQAFRLESLLTDPSCTDTPDSGVILQSSGENGRALAEVNGVEIRFNGTIFITAQVADKMTIYNLEGDTRAIVGDDRSNLEPGTITEIPLDASLAPTGAPSEPVAYSQADADLFAFLPTRLLSRNIEIPIFDPSSVEDTTDTTQQEEAPTPSPTEAPPEEPPPGIECPTLVQQSYTATEFLCENLDPNTACLGNTGLNMVASTPREGVENFTFANPGDITNSTDINSLITRVFDDPDNVWTSIVMTVSANTTTGATAQATILVFGEVDIQNQGVDPSDNVAEENTSTDTESAPPPAVATEEVSETITLPADGTPAAVEAPGGIIVRLEPRVDTETVGQLQDGDLVTALGRSVDQQWIQIQSADGTLTGWVFVQFIAVEGGADSLPIIDPNEAPSGNTSSAPPPATNQQAPPPPAGTTPIIGDTSEFTSMQAFDFTSKGVKSECPETSHGGIMIQSPDDADGDLILLINGVEFSMNGTVFLRASINENMNVIGLEGETIITALGTSQTVLAGQQATVELQNGLEPANVPSIPGDYDFDKGERYLFLPIRLLPRTFEVVLPPEPVDDASGDSDDREDSTPPEPIEGIVILADGTRVKFDADCQISAGDQVRNIRADAGSGFDVLSVLQLGETIQGVTQKRGTDQVYWYETARGWIRSDAGVTTPDCEVLPLSGVIYDTTSSGGEVASVAPVAPAAPPQPTSPPPPPLTSDAFGEVCSGGGFKVEFDVETSGQNFVEVGGVWTGRAGQSVTFTADVPYFRPELINILTFVNEDGSPWLGSINNPSFTINFESDRRFRVRVGALLGDFVSLRVNC